MILTTIPNCERYGWLDWQRNCGTLRLADDGDAPQKFTEPLSVAEVKRYLRVEDPDEDDLVQSLIAAARSQAELLQRRHLVSKQLELSLDYWPDWSIELGSPTTSVDLVQMRDYSGSTTDLVANTGYTFDLRKEPGILLPAYGKGWPSFTPYPSSAILIRFTCGYAAGDAFWRDKGARIKNGMLLLICGWYENRIPFAVGPSAIAEYPFAVTVCLSNGARARVI